MAKRDWSTTAADNNTADSDIDLEGSTASIRTADNSMRAIMQKDAIFLADNNGSRSTAGSSNTYTYASSGAGATPGDGFSAYATGDTLTIQANHTNTGAATLNVDSVGAKAIRKYINGAEAAIAAGDIVSDAPFTVIYDADANSAAGAWILQGTAKTYGWELIEISAVSSAASYTRSSLSAYRQLRLSGTIYTSADGAQLSLRTSTDNGSNYDSGATDYDYQTNLASGTGTANERAQANGIPIATAAEVGSDTGEALQLPGTILSDFNVARYLYVSSPVTVVNNSGNIFSGIVGGRRLQATARDAIQIIPDSGTITYYIVLEGIRG